MQALPDGLVAVVRRDCPTCILIEPVLGQLAASKTPLTVYTQDDPNFPSNVPHVVEDTSLEQSYRLNIEIVPTLIRAEGGLAVKRYKKPTFARVAPTELKQAISAECDVVIEALAD